MGAIVVPILWLMLNFGQLVIHSSRHGEQKKPSKYDGWTCLLGLAILLPLMYWSGFFDELIRRIFQ